MNKIVHIITGLGRGGAENTLLKYTKTFKNYTHVIIYLSSNYSLKRNFDKKNCQLFFIKDIFKYYSWTYLIKKLFQKEKQFYLIGWMYHGGLIAALLNIFNKNLNTTIYLHHSSIFRGNLKIRTIFIALLLGVLTTFNRLKVIWCSNSGLKNHKFIYRSKFKKAIPNGFIVKKNINLIPKNLIQEKFSILMITRWDKVKNNELAIKIFNEVHKIIPNTQLLLAGNNMTKENNELSKLIDKYSISNQIKLLGYVEELNKVIEKCDLLLLTSKSEAFPLAIGEAMNNGIPCVASNVGDIKEIIGDTGYTFKINQYKKAVEYILILIHEKINQKTKWIRRSKECRERISNNYNSKKIFDLLHNEFLSDFKMRLSK